MTVMKRGVNVVEIIPDYEKLATGLAEKVERRTVTDHDATHLILGHRPMHDQTKAQKNPWQVRCFEHEQSQEAKHSVGVLPTPDVDECAAER